MLIYQRIKISIALLFCFTVFVIVEIQRSEIIKPKKQTFIVEPYPTRNITRPTESKYLSGYRELLEGTPLQIFCQTCAFVSSSGQLLHKNSGENINSKSCVIRTNDAPIEHYEIDVGNRSDIRVVAHNAVMKLGAYLRTPAGKNEINTTTFVVWGPDRNMKIGGYADNYLRRLKKVYPEIKIYKLTNDQVNYADQVFEVETGKSRMASGAFLSTGWFSFLFMQQICGEINVYGMIDEYYCPNLRKTRAKDAPYHYYNDNSVGECAMYFYHEHAPRGAHRFITEKAVFKKWSRDNGNIFFHSPEWS